MHLYQLVEASSPQPLPLVFRAGGATKKTFAVACPPFGSVTMSNGVTLRCTGPAPTRPTELGPEAVHAAIALANPGHAPPPRPNDADLVCILDACRSALPEVFVDIPAGIAGNDPRPSNLRNAAQWLAAEGIPAPLVRELLAPHLHDDEHARAEAWAAGETPYSPSVGAEAIRRRDEIIKRKVQEKAATKKADTTAAKANTKTARELGLWVFRLPYTHESKSVLFTNALVHAGHEYALVERFAGLAGYACKFDGGLELMSDDFVLDCTVGKLAHAKRIPISTGELGAWIVKLVLMSRSPRITSSPVDVAGLRTDDDLDGLWRLKLAERVAWPWLDLQRVDLAASALIVGLELSPAVVEEAWLLLPGVQAERAAAERAKVVETWDDGVTTVRGGAAAFDAGKRDAIRAAIMRVVKGGIFHERGELYVPPSRADLDALAIETGRDPIRAVLASLVGGKKRIEPEDVDRALAEYAPGSPNNAWYQRILASMSFFGFKKKNVPNEENASGAGKAWVLDEEATPPPPEVEADPWPEKTRTVLHGFDSNGGGE